MVPPKDEPQLPTAPAINWAVRAAPEQTCSGRCGTTPGDAAARSALLKAIWVEDLDTIFELPGGCWLELGDGSPAPTHARVVHRTRSIARLLLGVAGACCDALCGGLGTDGAIDICQWRTFEVRRHNVIDEAAAMGVLRLLNACWLRAEVTVLGVQVAACTYVAEPLTTAAGLVEVLPQCVTLGELKRNCTKGDPAQRVAEHLERHPARLAHLAASTAALLASNYVLGAAAGDGDNLVLSSCGAIFRIDFTHLFGSRPNLVDLLPFDAPVVWLPKAVTTALGASWLEVQKAAQSAFCVAMAVLSPAPPLEGNMLGLWAQAQVALLKVEHALSLSVDRYLCGLAAADFVAALQVADRTLRKKVKTFLHDAFGYRSSTSAPARGRAILSSAGGWDAEDENSAPSTPMLHGGFESSASAVIDVTLAGATVEQSADIWRTAISVVACLRCDVEAGERTLQSLLWTLLASTVRSGEEEGRSKTTTVAAAAHVLMCLSLMARLGVGDLQRRLVTLAGGSRHHAECVLAMASSLRHGAPEEADSQKHSTVEFGAACAFVRLTLSVAEAGPVPAMGGAQPLHTVQAPARLGLELSPLAASECSTVRHSAIRVLLSALQHEKDPRLRSVVSVELPKYLTGADLAIAAQGMNAGELAELLRIAEHLAKDSCVEAGIREWARDCLAAMAQDPEADVRRAAVCAIACAAQDDDADLQQWARDFLRAATCNKDKADASVPGPLCLLALMAHEDGGARGACDLASLPAVTVQEERLVDRDVFFSNAFDRCAP